MTIPDPDDGSLQSGQDHDLDITLADSSEIETGIDPLNSLLDAEIKDEIDDERLYTDEFIRANENASRSLFLGFLGIALLGTSLFALYVMSQPQDEENPLPETNSIPVPSVPASPVPVTPIPPQPNLEVPPVSTPPSSSTPSSNPQSPLVFPVTPGTPSNSGSVVPAPPNPSSNPAPPPAPPN